MVSKAYHLRDSETFIQKALHWASGFDSVCYLDSNGYQDNYGKIHVFIAVGEEKAFVSDDVENTGPVIKQPTDECPSPATTLKRLQTFVDEHPGAWIPGFLSYDLKNELEDLVTREPNRTGMPGAYFFIPRYTLLIGKHNVEIRSDDPDLAIRQIENMLVEESESLGFQAKIKHRMSKSDYLDAFDKLQDNLQKGDCYEVNLCQEFYAEQVSIDPLVLYQRLNQVSPTPFSCFFKYGDKYILSASPERFLSKQGNTLLSQPIKGTARRGQDATEDELIKNELESSSKEISENIMIVDLVRNDLTKSAVAGSVRATELARVYSFQQVHQLISTVTCQLDPEVSPTQAIAHAFPPGSMTGAPKIRAMELIDQYENSRRGVYSGALGYFSPQGNFDFSVVIRTLIYNAGNGYLSFHAGGAITLESDPEQEYHECLLKGKALFEVLKGQ